MPKEQSEYVNWRGADNTMSIKKRIKRPTLHSKLKIEQHEPHKTLETGKCEVLSLRAIFI
jgi:hypothetical protein